MKRSKVIILYRVAIYVLFGLLFMFGVVTVCSAQTWGTYKGIRMVNNSDTTKQLPVQGSMFFDDVENKFYGYDGDKWGQFNLSSLDSTNFWRTKSDFEIQSPYLTATFNEGLLFQSNNTNSLLSLTSFNIALASQISATLSSGFEVNPLGVILTADNDNNTSSFNFSSNQFIFSGGSKTATGFNIMARPSLIDLRLMQLPTISDVGLQIAPKTFSVTKHGTARAPVLRVTRTNVGSGLYSTFFYYNDVESNNEVVINGPQNIDASIFVKTDTVNTAITAGKITTPTLQLTNLPTSCTGQPSGTIWNDAGTLKVCP